MLKMLLIKIFHKKNPNFSNKSNPKNKIKKYIDKRFLINLMDIKTNKEQRTTIRMMNIPSYFRPLDLAKNSMKNSEFLLKKKIEFMISFIYHLKKVKKMKD